MTDAAKPIREVLDALAKERRKIDYTPVVPFAVTDLAKAYHRGRLDGYAAAVQIVRDYRADDREGDA